MANIAFGSKYFIFSKFSSIPKTSKIEQERASLIKEYNDFKAFEDSKELQDFIELEKYLNSQEHKSLVAKLEKEKASEEEKIKKFEDQKKSKKFKSHFKFNESARLKDHQNFAKSSELAKYNALKKEIEDPEFSSRKKGLEEEKKKLAGKEQQLENLKKSKAVKNYLSDKGSEKESSAPEVKEYQKLKKELDSPEYKQHISKISGELNELLEKEKNFKKLEKSAQLKKYFKFDRSQKYKDFLSFEQSKELADHRVLKEYLESAEHKEKLQSVQKQLDEENSKKKAYEEFKNGKQYNWYLKLKGSDKFKELLRWELVFEDDFTGKQLDREKWMTRYYWGDKLINDAYALEHDKAFPTDGKNIETGNTLKIVTKREKVTGKVWKIPFGFVPQEFEYSTGLVSSAKSHWQQYGKVEAKIKVNYAKPVNYNFWMSSEKNLPHIDILKLQQKKSRVDVGHIYGDHSGKSTPAKKSAQFSGLDVSQDFFIYTLEWSKDKLTWKINDIVVNTQTQGVPQEKMYLVFSTAITGKPAESGLPASMEVDWVRCYKEK